MKYTLRKIFLLEMMGLCLPMTGLARNSVETDVAIVLHPEVLRSWWTQASREGEPPWWSCDLQATYREVWLFLLGAPSSHHRPDSGFCPSVEKYFGFGPDAPLTVERYRILLTGCCASSGHAPVTMQSFWREPPVQEAFCTCWTVVPSAREIPRYDDMEALAKDVATYFEKVRLRYLRENNRDFVLTVGLAYSY